MTTKAHNTWFEIHYKQAVRLDSAGLFHAALEIWSRLAEAPHLEREERCRALDGLGIAYLQLANYETALTFIQQAESLADTPDARCKYLQHEAIVYCRVHEYDKALRIIRLALEEQNSLSDSEKFASLLVNVCSVQWWNGFYADSVESAKRSLEISENAEAHPFLPEIHNNLGVSYLDMHEMEQAERHLLEAIRLSEGGVALSALSELSRLYFLQKDIEKTVEYSTEAAEFVWSSIVNFEKDEVAQLCRVLSNVSHHLGEYTVANRLLEKAQLMFGQLGMWHEWDSVQSQMDLWQETKSTPVSAGTTRITTIDIERFLTHLDVVNAQEVMSDTFSTLLDTRVLYAIALAGALDIPQEHCTNLVYACRFADYGLTALEPDVFANPHRSDYAWQQYKRHPELSVKMLHSLDLGLDVMDIIVDHHEHYDGSGYPSGKTGSEISYLARVLAVADRYAVGVVLGAKPHSQVLSEIVEASGTVYDPDIVNAFVQMFTGEPTEE